MSNQVKKNQDTSETSFLRGRIAALEAQVAKLSEVLNRNSQLLAEANQMLNHRADAATMRLDDLYAALPSFMDWAHLSESEALVRVANRNLYELAAATGANETSTETAKQLIVTPALKLVQDDEDTQVFEFGGNGGNGEESKSQS